MNKETYFLIALNRGACLKREWVNSLFSIVTTETHGPIFDYQIKTQGEDKLACFVDPDKADKGLSFIEVGPDNNALLISIKDKPLFQFNEKITIKEGYIQNYVGPPIETTYGRLLVNQLCLVIPFGTLFPFVNGPFNLKEIEQQINVRLIDDDDQLEQPPEGKIFVKQYLTFCDNALSLSGYNHLCVTSVSAKSLLAHPDAVRVREQLVEQNKEHLSDPVVVAKIGDALEQLDREWLKGDATANYYKVKDKKLYGAVRKKMYYHFGGESPFQEGTKVEYIEKSLAEGIDIEHLPAMVNSLRYGSYNRGKQTQLGGESTKTIYRMLGTIRIAEEDCGTQLGIPMKITKTNKQQFIGAGIIENGMTLLLDHTNIDQYVGKQPIVRGPLTCKTAGRNVCSVCIGKQFSEQPEGLAAAAAGVGGIFLTSFLKGFHSKTLATVRWDLSKTLS